MGRQTVSCIINGRPFKQEIDDSLTLLRLLRDELHMTGTKEGCSEGECGACTVLIDNKCYNSCIYLAVQAEGKSIVTIEGLNEDGEGQRIQEAFIAHGAIQCGYCSPGMILAVEALLLENSAPTTEEVKTAISGNICRCTGYKAIVDAVNTLVK